MRDRIRSWAVVVATAFQAFLLANLISFDYGRDQGIYAVVGDAIVRGGAPYKDAWDFKPPAIFFLFAAARSLFGGGHWGIRVIEAAAWATVPLCLARFVERRGGKWLLGFIAGVLATYIEVRAEYWHTGQPESFGAVLLVWALTLVTRPRNEAIVDADRWRWLCAGVLFGAAGLLKPPLGGASVPLLGVWLAERRRAADASLAARAAAEVILATVVGMGLPLLGVVVWFFRRGALGDLVDAIFGFAPHYTSLGSGIGRLPGNLARATWELLTSFSPMLAVSPLVWSPIVPPDVRRQVGLESVAAVAVFPWLGVALQGKFFPYHYEGCLPFVCLCAVSVYAALGARLLARGASKLAIGVAVAAVVTGFLVFEQYINPQVHFWDRVAMRGEAIVQPSRRSRLRAAMTSDGDVRTAENDRLSDWLRAAIPAGAPVFIWGFEPVVYDTSGHPAASRYVYDVPQRVPWARDEACRNLGSDLRDKPPAAVAVEREDRFPDVTGNTLDSADAITACDWLAGWLEQNYALDWESPKFAVFRRVDGAP